MSDAPVHHPSNSPSAESMAKRGWRQWAIAITLALGAILPVIDVNIVRASLRYMQGHLLATRSEIGWVLTGYGLATVLIFPLTAWLGDRLGRKTFIFSLSMFILASISCSIAGTLPALLLGRVLQGLAAGAVLGEAWSVFLRTFPKPEQGRAQTVFGLFSILMGPILGTILGVYLCEMFGWREIFLINLPLGVLAVILALIFFPVDAPIHPRRAVDGIGIAVMTASLAAWFLFFGAVRIHS